MVLLEGFTYHHYIATVNHIFTGLNIEAFINLTGAKQSGTVGKLAAYGGN